MVHASSLQLLPYLAVFLRETASAFPVGFSNMCIMVTLSYMIVQKYNAASIQEDY